MLEEILSYIHNYFIKEKYKGKFEISDGQFLCDFLQNGQYFRILGSIFNDGVYQYPVNELVDETFAGEIWAMAVPPSVIALVGEIEEWVSANSAVINSPYQSESFGGYSYSKGAGAGIESSGHKPSWAGVFGSRLNKWRKIS